MKQETFDKAQELNTKLNDLENNISRVEKREKGCCGLPINISFCYDEDYDALEKNILTYLKGRQTKLKREFTNLK